MRIPVDLPINLAMELDLLIKKKKRTIQLSVKSEPPPANTYKANTDRACINNIGRAGIGSVIRDDKGNWFIGFYEAIPQASTVQAEILALRKGLAIADLNNIRPLEINVDALEVIHLLNSNGSYYHNLFHQCRLLMETLQDDPPTRIFREQNKAADALTRIGLSATNFGNATFCLLPHPQLQM